MSFITSKLLIRTSKSQEQVSNTFHSFDTNIGIDHLYSNENLLSNTTEHTYQITIPNDSIIYQDTLEEIDQAILPDKILGYTIIKPEIYEIGTQTNTTTDRSDFLAQENLDKTRAIQQLQAHTYLPASQQLPKVTIGIIDTGIDPTHPDLGNHISTNIPGYDFVNNDADPTDDHLHGTHVAGTITASANQQGIIGVTQNASLVPLKICTAQGYCPSYAITKALTYAVDNNIDILNMSLGGRGTIINNATCQAIDHAVQNGIIVVAAAGNNNTNTLNSIPGACPGAITVAATDQNNSRATFSNYGTRVDISAPGVDIYSTIPGNSYKSLNGTSMATPHISALVAMIKAIHPDHSTQDIKDLLSNHSTPATYEEGKPISGVIDMPALMTTLGIEKTDVYIGTGTQVGTGSVGTGVNQDGTTIQNLPAPEFNISHRNITLQVGEKVDIIMSGGTAGYYPSFQRSGIATLGNVRRFYENRVLVYNAKQIANTNNYMLSVVGLEPGKTEMTITDKLGKKSYISIIVEPTYIHMLPNSVYNIYNISGIHSHYRTLVKSVDRSISPRDYRRMDYHEIHAGINTGFTSLVLQKRNSATNLNEQYTYHVYVGSEEEYQAYLEQESVFVPLSTSKDIYTGMVGEVFYVTVIGGKPTFFVKREDEDIVGYLSSSNKNGTRIAGIEKDVVFSITGNFITGTEYGISDMVTFTGDVDENIPNDANLGAETAIANDNTLTIGLLGLKEGETTLIIEDLQGEELRIPIKILPRIIHAEPGGAAGFGTLYASYSRISGIHWFDSNVMRYDYRGWKRHKKIYVKPQVTGPTQVVFRVHNTTERKNQYIYSDVYIGTKSQYDEYINDLQNPIEPLETSHETITLKVGETHTVGISKGRPIYSISKENNKIGLGKGSSITIASEQLGQFELGTGTNDHEEPGETNSGAIDTRTGDTQAISLTPSKTGNSLEIANTHDYHFNIIGLNPGTSSITITDKKQQTKTITITVEPNILKLPAHASYDLQGGSFYVFTKGYGYHDEYKMYTRYYHGRGLEINTLTDKKRPNFRIDTHLPDEDQTLPMYIDLLIGDPDGRSYQAQQGIHLSHTKLNTKVEQAVQLDINYGTPPFTITKTNENIAFVADRHIQHTIGLASDEPQPTYIFGNEETQDEQPEDLEAYLERRNTQLQSGENLEIANHLTEKHSIRILGLQAGTTQVSITDATGKTVELPVTTHPAPMKTFSAQEHEYTEIYYLNDGLRGRVDGYNTPAQEIVERKRCYSDGRCLYGFRAPGIVELPLSFYNPYEGKYQTLHQTIKILNPQETLTTDKTSITLIPGQATTLKISGGYPRYTGTRSDPAVIGTYNLEPKYADEVHVVHTQNTEPKDSTRADNLQALLQDIATDINPYGILRSTESSTGTQFSGNMTTDIDTEESTSDISIASHQDEDGNYYQEIGILGLKPGISTLNIYDQTGQEVEVEIIVNEHIYELESAYLSGDRQNPIDFSRCARLPRDIPQEQKFRRYQIYVPYYPYGGNPYDMRKDPLFDRSIGQTNGEYICGASNGSTKVPIQTNAGIIYYDVETTGMTYEDLIALLTRYKEEAEAYKNATGGKASSINPDGSNVVGGNDNQQQSDQPNYKQTQHKPSLETIDIGDEDITFAVITREVAPTSVQLNYDNGTTHTLITQDKTTLAIIDPRQGERNILYQDAFGETFAVPKGVHISNTDNGGDSIQIANLYLDDELKARAVEVLGRYEIEKITQLQELINQESKYLKRRPMLNDLFDYVIDVLENQGGTNTEKVIYLEANQDYVFIMKHGKTYDISAPKKIAFNNLSLLANISENINLANNIYNDMFSFTITYDMIANKFGPEMFLGVGEYTINISSEVGTYDLVLKMENINHENNIIPVSDDLMLLKLDHQDAAHYVTDVFQVAAFSIKNMNLKNRILEFKKQFGKGGEWNLKETLVENGYIEEDEQYIVFGKHTVHTADLGNLLFGFLADLGNIYLLAVEIAYNREAVNYQKFYGLYANKRATADENADKPWYKLGKDLEGFFVETISHDQLYAYIEDIIDQGNELSQPLKLKDQSVAEEICELTKGGTYKCISLGCFELVSDYWIYEKGSGKVINSSNVNCQ